MIDQVHEVLVAVSSRPGPLADGELAVAVRVGHRRAPDLRALDEAARGDHRPAPVHTRQAVLPAPALPDAPADVYHPRSPRLRPARASGAADVQAVEIETGEPTIASDRAAPYATAGWSPMTSRSGRPAAELRLVLARQRARAAYSAEGQARAEQRGELRDRGFHTVA